MKTCILLIAISIVVTRGIVVTKALACSVNRIATAAEITDGADVILLVKVPEVTVKDISPIEMAVIDVVKGEFKSKTVTQNGQTVRYDGANERTVPYDFVRKGGRHGNCYATDYRPGGQFLLFLKDGKIHWSPLAPTNEEVSGPKDAWVVWVNDRLKTK